MKTWLKRLALSFIITFGFVPNRLPAQAPLVPPSQPFDTAPSAPMVALLARPELPREPSLTPHLNRLGYLCDSDLGWYACPGIRSNYDFILGSARTYFIEPCLPMPVHPSLQKYAR